MYSLHLRKFSIDSNDIDDPKNDVVNERRSLHWELHDPGVSPILTTSGIMVVLAKSLGRLCQLTKFTIRICEIDEKHCTCQLPWTFLGAQLLNCKSSQSRHYVVGMLHPRGLLQKCQEPVICNRSPDDWTGYANFLRNSHSWHMVLRLQPSLFFHRVKQMALFFACWTRDSTARDLCDKDVQIEHVHCHHFRKATWISDGFLLHQKTKGSCSFVMWRDAPLSRMDSGVFISRSERDATSSFCIAQFNGRKNFHMLGHKFLEHNQCVCATSRLFIRRSVRPPRRFRMRNNWYFFSNILFPIFDQFCFTQKVFWSSGFDKWFFSAREWSNVLARPTE